MRLWPLALGLLVPATAGAQQQIEVEEGEPIPNLRACVDYVGRGALHSTGHSDVINDPDDLLGHSVYWYRFGERVELFGHSGWRSRRLAMGGHSLRAVHISDALVFLGRNARFVDWSWVWRDRAGRAFLPIFSWPDPGTHQGWEPAAIRKFARPVVYDAPQPYWPDIDFDEEEDADLYVRRGGHGFVRYGLYLSDMPALFRAAETENCWR